MSKNKNSLELLFSTASPKELSTSIDCAFQTMITSDAYCQFKYEDRVRLVFHWELLRDYFDNFN